MKVLMDNNLNANWLVEYGKVIFNSGKEIATDLAEVGVDQLLDDGVIREIPVLGILQKTGKLLLDIRNLYITKHVLVFAQNLNRGSLNRTEIIKHYENLEKNPKKKIMELETIINHVSIHYKYIQDKILANFYMLYCNPEDDFGWKDFELMAQITGEIFPNDLEALKDIYDKERFETQNFDRYAIGRLSKLGLVDYFNGMVVSESNGAEANGFYARINKLGSCYWELGVRDLKLYQNFDGEMRII